MSDIRFCIAPIGGGKSRYGASVALTELLKSYRQVVTSVPHVMAGDDVDSGHMTVGAWCRKYCKEPIELSKRFRVLRDVKEVRYFWRKLPGRDLPLIRSEDFGRKEDNYMVADLASRQGDGGCLYILDEVHLAFRARDWGSIGPEVEYYMSQCRKFNDDIILITQHPDKVDKNFRRNATEWFYFRNMGKARLFMGVSFPNQFRYEIYDQQPARNDKPLQSGKFRLRDMEFEKTYLSMAGVGLGGQGLETEDSMHKGRSWLVWPAALVLVLVFFLVSFHYVMYGSGWLAKTAVFGFSKGISGAVSPLKGVTNVPGRGVAASSAKVTMQSTKSASAPTLDASSDLSQAPLTCRGTVVLDGYPMAFMSNGHVVDGYDVPIVVLRHEVVIAGHHFPIQADFPDPTTSVPDLQGGVVGVSDLYSHGSASVSVVGSRFGTSPVDRVPNTWTPNPGFGGGNQGGMVGTSVAY